MREILPGQLWIGNARDARDVRGVLSAGVRVVVDLALEELPIVFPRDMISCRFPLLDGSGNSPVLLMSAVATVTHFLENRYAVLVACSGGMSRSPAVASAALAAVRSLPLADAAALVAAQRGCDISPALWQDVQAVFTSGLS